MKTKKYIRDFEGGLLFLAAIGPLLIVCGEVLLHPDGLFQILIAKPVYLYRFWKSLALCGCIILFHIVISCMAGYAFAHYQFSCKKGIFIALIVLMMLPLQVTLVPCYIVLDRLHLLDTWLALALPCIVSPLGTILMARAIKSVPIEVIEAAEMDGANTWKRLWKIVVPCARNGVISLILLTFVDVWNMVEQPMVFLSNADSYPLSVFLAVMNTSNKSVTYAGAMLSMLPVFLVTLYFKDDLAEEAFTGVK